MLFNSIDFLIFGVVVFLTIAAIRARKYQHLFLLAASWFFYWYSRGFFFLLFLFSTIMDFYLAHLIFQAKERRHKRLLLVVSLIGNLGMLGYFKYTNFSIESLNAIATALGFDIRLRT